MRPDQVRRRMRSAPELAPHAGGHPDPAEVSARVLAPLRLAGRIAGCSLAILALAAEFATSDPRAALLPGVPALGLLLVDRMSRPFERRRLAAVATTSLAGFTAIATAPSLAAADRIRSPEGHAVMWQLLILLVSGILLFVAWIGWRDFHRAVGVAADTDRAFREL